MNNIELKYKNAIIQLQLSSFVTVITGITGSGKSMICDALVDASRQGLLGKPVHRVIPDNYSTFNFVPKKDEALLVIDNADMLFAKYPKAADLLNTMQYQALVIARDTGRLKYPPYACGIIRQKGNLYYFVPLSEALDYV